jgi:ferrochelatase
MDALKGLVCFGKKHVVLVPIAFTSDHIETLYELDLELWEGGAWGTIILPPVLCRIAVIDEETMRGQLGVEVHRAESLNGSSVLIRVFADIVAQHSKENFAGAPPTSVQMGLRCPGCLNVNMCAAEVVLRAGSNA